MTSKQQEMEEYEAKIAAELEGEEEELELEVVDEEDEDSDEAKKLEDMKALEKALADRIISRLAGPYPYTWPYSSDIAK